MVVGEKFHAILTDPPYELGFMGKDWDKTGIVFNPDTWKKLGEHLHDGGFLMAFASSRGWHRLACAIEDAGFVIHPTIFGWSFGSGFPKATRVKGNEIFSGHRYGLQALKPALEPIIVAQKPYKGKPVENITRTGAGALNIDGGRIGTETVGWGGNASEGYQGGWTKDENARPVKGRWPSNLLLYHTPECRKEGVKKVRGNGAFPQKINGNSPIAFRGNEERESRIEMTDPDGNETIPNWVCHPDCPVAKMDKQQEGSARFFHQVQTQLDEADPIIYKAKASRTERDAGLEGMEETADSAKGNGLARICENCRVSILKPELCECEIKSWILPKQKNHHPTVKPIALTKYLATLLLPPKEYTPRKILVPFAGVASEMIGAIQAGWEEVVGIELEREYCEIAEKRIEYYENKLNETLF